MKADLIVDGTLYPTEQGGRSGPTPAGWFGCVCLKDRDAARVGWDCRILLDGSPLVPGEMRRVGIAFLSGEEAANDLRQTGKFFLRELGIIGEAVIAD